MFQVENVEQWRGQEVVDTDGEKVGKLDEVLFDTRTNQPTLAVVKTGRLGRTHVLVPLAGATLGRDQVRVVHSRAVVESAPRLDATALRREDEVLLAHHYGVTPPATDEATDTGVLYESATAVEQRRAAARADSEKAAALEAEAERKQAEVVHGQTVAAQAGERADAAEDERRRLLAEAEELRRRADA